MTLCRDSTQGWEENEAAELENILMLTVIAASAAAVFFDVSLPYFHGHQMDLWKDIRQIIPHLD